jgi:hypothetical protein
MVSIVIGMVGMTSIAAMVAAGAMATRAPASLVRVRRR